MSIKKDWMERQIEAISNTVAAILFGKDQVKAILDMDEEEDAVADMEEDLLDRMVKKALIDGTINEAENLVFNAIDQNKRNRRLMIALEFFNEVHGYDEEKLRQANYSKEEIEDGIKQLRELYEDNVKVDGINRLEGPYKVDSKIKKKRKLPKALDRDV